MTPHLKYQVCLCSYKTSICEQTLLSVNLLLKFPGFSRFPLNFQDFSGFSLRGWGISFLGQDFCTPAGRGTLFGAGERKNPESIATLPPFGPMEG